MAYLVDVYRKEISAERSPLNFALFMLFFPQLVAGPIERYAHLMPQLKDIGERFRNSSDRFGGLFMILLGLVLKLTIADNLGVFVDETYRAIDSAGPGDVLLATYFFSIQIYGDFYGYTLIALGVAAVFGIDLINNFNHPYFATNIQEFWRRWHISLSRWFRDYMYIPLGGNRVGPFRLAFNLTLTFVAVGFWHGANFTFLVWGGLHGLMLTVHRLFQKLAGESRNWFSRHVRGLVSWLLTFHGVTLAWVLFRAPNFDVARVAYSKLLEVPGQLFTNGVVVFSPYADFHLLIVGGFIVLAAADYLFDLRASYRKAPLVLQCAIAAILMLAVLMGPERDVQFIYFQF